MNLAPIALFVYNRPSHTQRTIDALRDNKLARESDLFIFSDAARDEVAKPRVDAVREIIAAIDGFKSVRIVLRDRNWGLAASVIDGVTGLCRDYDKAIVLEDDLVVAPGFLQYMNQALEKYKDEPAVMQISGYMFPVETKQDTDAFFLPFTTSWGWATWQRAWKEFDPAAKAFKALESDKRLRKSFDLNGAYPYFRMLQLQQQGKIDSWAIRWNLSVFMAAGLTLFPTRTLVLNTGFDGSGTHCGNEMPHEQINSGFAPKIFPEKVTVDILARKRVFDYLASHLDVWGLIKYKILNL